MRKIVIIINRFSSFFKPEVNECTLEEYERKKCAEKLIEQSKDLCYGFQYHIIPTRDKKNSWEA